MQEILEAWRMQLGDTIVDVKARQLPPQKMIGGNNRSYEGQRAEWARHVRQAGNFRSQELVNWILVCPSIPTVIDLAKRFISLFSLLVQRLLGETQTIGQQMGMTVGQPMCDVVSTGEVAAYSEVIKKCIQSAGDEKVHMIVVLLNDDSKTRYDALKKMLSNDIPSSFISLTVMCLQFPRRWCSSRRSPESRRIAVRTRTSARSFSRSSSR